MKIKNKNNDKNKRMIVNHDKTISIFISNLSGLYLISELEYRFVFIHYVNK